MDDVKLLKLLDRPLQWIFPKQLGSSAQSLRQALGVARTAKAGTDGPIAAMMCPLLSIEVGGAQIDSLLTQVPE